MINENIPESKKLEKEYLIHSINKHINELFTDDKTFEKKCFNFAAGIRDKEEMSYLKNNYGVSNPTDIPFVPITKKRINYLVNKALQNHLDYQVTCQNKEAIEYKLQQKKYLILNDLITTITNYANENVKILQEGKKQKDLRVEDLLKTIKEKYNDNWKTDIEIAAYNYIQYYIDRYELKLKFNQAMENLIIAGQMYFRTYIKEIGKDPVFEIVSPEELYLDENNYEFWVRNHKRAVRIKYMTPTDIISEFGHYLSDEEREKINKIFFSNNQTKYPHLVNSSGNILDNYQEDTFDTTRLVRVFHVEWISNNPVDYDSDSLDLLDNIENNLGKKRYRQDRYEGYKIDVGSGIYIACGKTKYVNRSLMNPYECTLSYDGFRYKYRNGKPYSILWKTRDIQNMFDLTYFQLSSLFSSIMPGSSIIPEEAIPNSYGNTPEERLFKFVGYRKLGLPTIVSLSQEGSESLGGFSNWGAALPSNVDGGLIQALQAQLELLEQQLDNIMGITRQSLGEMEERDGKSTTMMAVSNAEIVSKDIYFHNSMFIKHALTSIVNLARIAHKEGFIGAYSLGLDHKIFSLDAEKFTIADYNVFFSDDIEDVEKLKIANDIVAQALSAQMISLRKAFDVLMEKSISMKKKIIENTSIEQEEQQKQMVEQLQQQLEELQKNIEALQKENEKLKNQKNNIDEIELKRQELLHKIETDKKKLKLEETKMIDDKAIKEEQLRLQILQITDNNPYNDKIKKLES